MAAGLGARVQILDIDAEFLVPGDIVYLESGNRVPADLRLLMDHGLEMDESLRVAALRPLERMMEIRI